MFVMGLVTGVIVSSLMEIDNLLKVKTWVLNLWEKVKK
jgi:hypothetical protein